MPCAVLIYTERCASVRGFVSLVRRRGHDHCVYDNIILCYIYACIMTRARPYIVKNIIIAGACSVYSCELLVGHHYHHIVVIMINFLGFCVGDEKPLSLYCIVVAIYVGTYRQKSDKHCTRLVSQKNIASKRVFKTSWNFARPFRMRLYFIMLPSVYIIVFAIKPYRTRFLFHIYPKKSLKINM